MYWVHNILIIIRVWFSRVFFLFFRVHFSRVFFFSFVYRFPGCFFVRRVFSLGIFSKTSQYSRPIWFQTTYQKRVTRESPITPRVITREGYSDSIILNSRGRRDYHYITFGEQKCVWIILLWSAVKKNVNNFQRRLCACNNHRLGTGSRSGIFDFFFFWEPIVFRRRVRFQVFLGSARKPIPRKPRSIFIKKDDETPHVGSD